MFGSRSITDQSTDIEKLTQKLDTAVKAEKTHYWPWETSLSRIHSQLEQKISNIEKAISNQNSISSVDSESVDSELIALNIEKARIAISDYNTANKTRKTASSFFTKLTTSLFPSKGTPPSINSQGVSHTALKKNTLITQYKELLGKKGLIPLEKFDPILKLDENTNISVVLKSIAQITRILDSTTDKELRTHIYSQIQEIALSQPDAEKKIESVKLNLQILHELKKVIPQDKISINNKIQLDPTKNDKIKSILTSKDQKLIAKKIIYFIRSINHPMIKEEEKTTLWSNLIQKLDLEKDNSSTTADTIDSVIFDSIQNSYEIRANSKTPVREYWIQQSYITKILEDLEIPEEKAPPILFEDSETTKNKGRLLSALEQSFKKEGTNGDDKTKVLEYCQRLSTIPQGDLKKNLKNLITSRLPPSQFFVQEKLKIAFKVDEKMENNKQTGIPAHSKLYNNAINSKDDSYKNQLFERMADVIEHLERTGHTTNQIAAFFKKLDETGTEEDRNNPDFFAHLANQVIEEFNKSNTKKIPPIRLTWKEWFAVNFQ